VDLGPRSGAELPGQSIGGAVEAYGHADQASRIHSPVRVVLDRGREPSRGAEDTDRRDIAEHEVAAVDQARRA